MKKHNAKINWHQLTLKSAEGFTIVEVMLVLAITGLMLAGLIGGTFSAIGQQRYNDTYRDLAEYFSRIYSEVLAPETFGAGNSSSQAILGKILVFGHEYDNVDDNHSIFSATLVGSADISRATNTTFLNELTSEDTGIAIICGNNSTGQSSSVERYLPLWQSWLQTAVSDTNPNPAPFRGAMIIARTPTSNMIHTVFTSNEAFILNLRDQCTPDNATASTLFNRLMTENHSDTARGLLADSLEQSTNICVKSDDSQVVRAIEITADGSNTSAVKTLTEESSRCE